VAGELAGCESDCKVCKGFGKFGWNMDGNEYGGFQMLKQSTLKLLLENPKLPLHMFQ